MMELQLKGQSPVRFRPGGAAQQCNKAWYIQHFRDDFQALGTCIIKRYQTLSTKLLNSVGNVLPWDTRLANLTFPPGAREYIGFSDFAHVSDFVDFLYFSGFLYFSDFVDFSD